MVDTGAGAKNIFRQVDQIHIAVLHHWEHVYFGMIGIVYGGNEVLTNPLAVSDLPA